MILDFEMFELDDLETCFSEVQHLFRIMLKNAFQMTMGCHPPKIFPLIFSSRNRCYYFIVATQRAALITHHFVEHNTKGLFVFS